MWVKIILGKRSTRANILSQERPMWLSWGNWGSPGGRVEMVGKVNTACKSLLVVFWLLLWDGIPLGLEHRDGIWHDLKGLCCMLCGDRLLRSKKLDPPGSYRSNRRWGFRPLWQQKQVNFWIKFERTGRSVRNQGWCLDFGPVQRNVIYWGPEQVCLCTCQCVDTVQL